MKRKSKNQSKNKTLNFLRYLGPGLLVTVGFIDPETFEYCANSALLGKFTPPNTMGIVEISG